MSLLITLAQVKTIAGDIKYNKDKIIHAIRNAQRERSSIIVFPELTLSGYGANELLLKEDFFDEIHDALQQIIEASADIITLVGFPERVKERRYSSIAIIKNGKLLGSHRKILLPNAELFTENYYLSQGDTPTTITINDITFGIAISEEIFDPNILPNCDILLLSSAFNWSYENPNDKEDRLKYTAQLNNTPIIFVNALSSSDNLIFSGNSSVIDSNGEIISRLYRFRESETTISLAELQSSPPITTKLPEGQSVLYDALSFALNEFIHQSSSYETVTLHIDHNLESQLLLALAVDTLGSDKVKAVYFYSKHDLPSKSAAIVERCNRLNITLIQKPLDKTTVHNTLIEIAERANIEFRSDWEEQSLERIKGALFLSYSDLISSLPLGSINKTQVALGLKRQGAASIALYMPFIDLYRKDILTLAEYRNSISQIFDNDFIQNEKERSIKYSNFHTQPIKLNEIDDIIYRYLERNESVKHIVKQNYNEELVRNIITLIHRPEIFKNFSTLGPKLSAHAFSKNWHSPKVLFQNKESHF